MNWLTSPLLAVEKLTMRFGGLIAVNAFTFTVGRGDITALIGPNGAGKTTVFNCVTGFYKPTEGRLAFARDGIATSEDVEAATKASGAPREDRERRPLPARAHARPRDRAHRAGGAHLPEHPPLPGDDGARKSAGRASQSADAGERHDGARPHRRAGYRRKEAEAIDRATYWLDKIGLTDRADDPAGELPYGAQRRLEIARAMCTDPVLLCLDEPAAGLNPRESADLSALLRSIRADHNTSVLLIEHDMSVVMQISDHVVVLDYGVKIADGTPAGSARRSEGHRRLSRRRRRRGSRSHREGARAMSAAAAGAGAAPATAGRRDLLRQDPGAQGRRHRRQPWRDRHPDRRQRRRQVDDDDDHLRRAARPSRQDHASTAGTSPPCRRIRSRACRSPSRRKAGASFRA